MSARRYEALLAETNALDDHIACMSVRVSCWGWIQLNESYASEPFADRVNCSVRLIGLRSRRPD